MSEQNKPNGAPSTDTTPSSATPGNSGGQPSKDVNKPDAPKTPNHEQGREHVPNVNAQRDAADTRRTAEQAHMPSAAPDSAQEPNTDLDAETGDAERSEARGQGDGKPVNPHAKLVAGSDSSGKG